MNTENERLYSTRLALEVRNNVDGIDAEELRQMWRSCWTKGILKNREAGFSQFGVTHRSTVSLKIYLTLQDEGGKAEGRCVSHQLSYSSFLQRVEIRLIPPSCLWGEYEATSTTRLPARTSKAHEWTRASSLNAAGSGFIFKTWHRTSHLTL